MKELDKIYKEIETCNKTTEALDYEPSTINNYTKHQLTIKLLKKVFRTTSLLFIPAIYNILFYNLSIHLDQVQQMHQTNIASTFLSYLATISILSRSDD